MVETATCDYCSTHVLSLPYILLFDNEEHTLEKITHNFGVLVLAQSFENENENDHFINYNLNSCSFNES